MPYCPHCKEEYRTGFTVCAECGATLRDRLPTDQEYRLEMMRTPGSGLRRTLLIVTTDSAQSEKVVEVLRQNGIGVSIQELDVEEYLEESDGFSMYGEDIFVDMDDYALALQLVNELAF